MSEEKQEEVVDMDELVNKELDDVPVDPPVDVKPVTEGNDTSGAVEDRESEK